MNAKIPIHHKKSIAEMFGVSVDYVAKVLNGKRHNKAIKDAYEVLKSSEKETVKKLQARVKKLQTATL